MQHVSHSTPCCWLELLRCASAWLCPSFSEVVAPCNVFNSEKILSQIYPKITHTVCLKIACAKCTAESHLPHFKFKVFLFGKGFLVIHMLMREGGRRLNSSFEGKNKSCTSDGATTWDSTIQLLFKNLASNVPKGNDPTARIICTNSWMWGPARHELQRQNMSE